MYLGFERAATRSARKVDGRTGLYDCSGVTPDAREDHGLSSVLLGAIVGVF